MVFDKEKLKEFFKEQQVSGTEGLQALLCDMKKEVIETLYDRELTAHLEYEKHAQGDNISAAEQAVEYLVGLGHRKIGFIGGELQLTNFQERFDGYPSGMEKAGIEVDEQWSVNDISLSDTEGGIQALHRLLARKDMPSAVIASCDSVAFGIYKAAEERSLTIPHDLSVLSFDDSVIAKYVSPPLITFRQQLNKIGAIAVEKLLNILDGSDIRKNSEKIQIPMNLIVRNSVKTYAPRS